VTKLIDFLQLRDYNIYKPRLIKNITITNTITRAYNVEFVLMANFSLMAK